MAAIEFRDGQAEFALGQLSIQIGGVKQQIGAMQGQAERDAHEPGRNQGNPRREVTMMNMDMPNPAAA